MNTTDSQNPISIVLQPDQREALNKEIQQETDKLIWENRLFAIRTDKILAIVTSRILKKYTKTVNDLIKKRSEE